MVQMNLQNRNRISDTENKLIVTKREKIWGEISVKLVDKNY